MPINPNKQVYDKGLAERQRVMDLIAAGAYDNYEPSINVPDSQLTADRSMMAANRMNSRFVPPQQVEGMHGPQLPALNSVADTYAVAQNPLYTPSKGVRHDFTDRNLALQEMDIAINNRQEMLRQQMRQKMQSRTQPQQITQR